MSIFKDIGKNIANTISGFNPISTAVGMAMPFVNEFFENRRYNKQRSDMLADRDYQNQYNSPVAQMERLKEAGLNPNLVYGNGAAQMPSAQGQQVERKDVNTDPLGRILQSKQIELLNADIEGKRIDNADKEMRLNADRDPTYGYSTQLRQEANQRDSVWLMDSLKRNQGMLTESYFSNLSEAESQKWTDTLLENVWTRLNNDTKLNRIQLKSAGEALEQLKKEGVLQDHIISGQIKSIELQKILDGDMIALYKLMDKLNLPSYIGIPIKAAAKSALQFVGRQSTSRQAVSNQRTTYNVRNNYY